MTEPDGLNPNPRFRFNLRGWAFYHFVKLLTPNLADPKVLAETIRKDRMRGPSTLPKRFLAKLDFRETEDDGMRVFRTHRKGAPVPPLKLLYLHGGAYVLDLQDIQWNLVAGLLERIDAEVIAPIYPLAPEAGWDVTTTAVRRHFLGLVDRFGAENIIVWRLCGRRPGSPSGAGNA